MRLQPTSHSVLALLLGGGLVWAQPAPEASVVSAGAPASVPTFEVRRYEVSGSAVLDQSAIDQVMAEAVGPAVSVPLIRRTLAKLQQAYRDRGHASAAVQLPRQAMTDGVVRLRVIEGPSHRGPEPAPPVDLSTLPDWTAPAYDVRHFEVRGNTLLPVEEIDRILSPAAGSNTSVETLQDALHRLREAYRQRGHTRVAVQLRQQLLTDGTVAIWIDEGLTPEPARDRKQLAATVEETPADGPFFEVRRYEVEGNTLLRPEIIAEIFAGAVGSEVSLSQIQSALGELQLAYRERGFATVSVSLPQQQLTDATVTVQVTEGVLADIQVLGNRHFSTDNVLRALPSLRTNAQLNSLIFQRELDLANQNRDRQIYPTIGPGPEPGTSALTLRVKDRLPLHGRLEINNHATPGTPEWRINASAQYNNLWQREHQVGLSYGFTPEAYKDKGVVSDYLLNRPLIANYGAYYRLPFGAAESLEDQISRSGAFGYDEATRQFRLPPPGSRPDLTVFASASSSDTGVQLGPATIVSQTPLLTILSQDSGQNISLNEGVGARLSVPQTLDERRRFSFSFGPDWKRYSLESFNTNNFIITTVVTNAQGSQTIESRVASPQPARRNGVQYLPLFIGGDFSMTDAGGTFSASVGFSGNFVGGDGSFAALSYSPRAGAQYGKATLALTRDQQVFRDWSLLLRANGQAATGPLISTEQFALGGVNSVRGYYEGDQYGDSGWLGSVELRTPFISTRAPGWSGDWPVWVRGSVFMDYGEAYLLHPGAVSDARLQLWGTGFGVSANVNHAVDLRIVVGWPLLETVNTSEGDPRAYFSLGGQF